MSMLLIKSPSLVKLAKETHICCVSYVTRRESASRHLSFGGFISGRSMWMWLYLLLILHFVDTGHRITAWEIARE